MDPSRNAALQSSKLRALLSTSPSTMPPHPPPSYHTVVDPNTPIHNMQSPYDHDEEVEKEETEEEIPEVTINATTQIRGHGNIISVPPMDAVRIAGLLHTMMFGPPQLPSPTLSPQQQPLGVHREYQSSPQTQPSPQQQQRQPLGTTHASVQTGLKNMPKINITVNCGATVVGDKNIVGPGLGDIVRHMQIRNQMAAAQQAHAQAQAQAAKAAHVHHHMSMPVPILTPMRSRRNSEESASSTGSKRRSEDEAEGSPRYKRQNV